MSKRANLKKLCLKPSTSKKGHFDYEPPTQIKNFFKPTDPINDQPTHDRINETTPTAHNQEELVPKIQPTITNHLKEFVRTSEKIAKISKTSSNPETVITSFLKSDHQDESICDFEPKKARTVTKTKSNNTTTPKRSVRRRNNQTDLRKMLSGKSNKPIKNDENLFAELMAQQSMSEDLDPDDLQMAIMLSRSIAESFASQDSQSSSESIQPQNVEQQQSTSDRFNDIQHTLEKFGFKSKSEYTKSDLNRILRAGVSNGRMKSRRQRISRRSMEYMRKPLAEKVAQVYESGASETNADISHQARYKLTSQFLSSLKCNKLSKFKLQSIEDRTDQHPNDYYCDLELIEQSIIPCGYLLKNWAAIPGRSPSPVKQQFSDETFTQDSMDIALDFTVDSDYKNAHVMSGCRSPDLFSDSEADDDGSVLPPETIEVKSSGEENTSQSQQIFPSPDIPTTYTIERPVPNEHLTNLIEIQSEPLSLKLDDPVGQIDQQLGDDNLVSQIKVVETSITVQRTPNNSGGDELLCFDNYTSDEETIEVKSSGEENTSQSQQIFPSPDIPTTYTIERPVPNEHLTNSIEIQSEPEDTPNISLTTALSFKLDDPEGQIEQFDEENLVSQIKVVETSITVQRTPNNSGGDEILCFDNYTSDEEKIGKRSSKANISDELFGDISTETIDLTQENEIPDESDKNQSTEKQSDTSFVISDDEINYSTSNGNNENEQKIIEIVDSDSTISDYDYDLEFNRSLIKVNEKTILEEIEKENQEDFVENDQVNQSVNEYLFKLAGDVSKSAKKLIETPTLSTGKHQRNSSSKKSFKRYSSEPNFGNVRTRRLSFPAVVNEIEDRLSPLPYNDDYEVNEISYNFYNPIENDIPEIRKSPKNTVDVNPISGDYDEYDALVGYDEEVVNLGAPNVRVGNINDDRSFSVKDPNTTLDLNETNVDGDKYIYKTENVTPKPDYKSMTVESLHVELKKFGLKKLSRRKAILLLEHIYNNTHPILLGNDEEMTDHPITLSQPVSTNMSPPPAPSSQTTESTKGAFSGIDFAAVDFDADLLKPSNFSSNYNEDDMIYLPSKPRSGKIQYCFVPLHIAFHNLFMSNSKLRRSILMYQPIELEKLHAHFKGIGLKFEINDLVAFLDKHCITFRTESKSKANRCAKAKKKI